MDSGDGIPRLDLASLQPSAFLLKIQDLTRLQAEPVTEGLGDGDLVKGKPGTGTEFRNCGEIRASPRFAGSAIA